MHYVVTGSSFEFSKKRCFFTLGAYSSCPTWARDPPKSSKRYISGLFEKSVPNMVTYLCKVLSKLHFPEGDTFFSQIV